MLLNRRWLLAMAGALMVPGCSSGSGSGCQQGTERCACYGNGTCDPGLSCLSDKCVNPASGSGDTGGETPGVDLDACVACGKLACSDQWSACEGQGGCEELTECSLACGQDLSCLAECEEQATAEDVNRASSFAQCAFLECMAQCTGAQSSPTGSVAVPQPGAPGEGTPTPEPDSTEPGSAGPSTPTVQSGERNWFTLEGSVAPGTDPVNAALNIDGVFYAYSDGCASVSWDAEQRCISGTLCERSEENWGAGIGFDFRNDGTSKYAWDATAAHTDGAYAVAWRTAGASNREFQVWLTNIDPSVGGQCAATTDCAINGPPDGEAHAAPEGQLFFDNLRKDDWGGTGIDYAFDPSQVLAVQFKLPSSTTPTDYELCILELGAYVY